VSQAVALQCGGVASKIELIDINGRLLRGQDLESSNWRVDGSGPADHARRAKRTFPREADLVMGTARLRRKHDESRRD